LINILIADLGFAPAFPIGDMKFRSNAKNELPEKRSQQTSDGYGTVQETLRHGTHIVLRSLPLDFFGQRFRFSAHHPRVFSFSCLVWQPDSFVSLVLT
jgi:hypothetical protein